jgi:hypothetical protein
MNARALPMRRMLPLLLFALPFPACRSLAPPSDPAVAAAAAEAHREAMAIVARAEAGGFRDRASFAEAASLYAAADARLAAAADRAAGRSPGSPGPAGRGGVLVAGQIGGCRMQLASLARIHRRSGIAPGAGLTEQVAASCDMAARAAGGTAKRESGR